MSKRATGQWWDETLSPVSGCTPVGDGCSACHSIRRMKRHLPMLRGRGNELVSPHTILLHPERLEKPRHWRAPRIILTPMLGDYFHEDVPREMCKALVGLAADTARHTYVVLTKRYQRAAEFFDDCPPPPNIILLASVWDQPSADAACAALSQLRGVRWGLHAEPLLGPVVLPQRVACTAGQAEYIGLRWIVVGGENGPGARMMELQWALDLQDQCSSSNVPFWFKGVGTATEKRTIWSDETLAAVCELEASNEVPW